MRVRSANRTLAGLEEIVVKQSRFWQPLRALDSKVKVWAPRRRRLKALPSLSETPQSP